jgi:hypothetical protein
MNAESPPHRSYLSRPQTTITPARSPEVIHCLLPFSTQPSPVRRARVSRAEASLPACGSESAKAPADRLLPRRAGYVPLLLLLGAEGA